MSGALVWTGLFQSLSKFLGTKILDSSTVLKIPYRLSLMYLGTQRETRIGPRLEESAEGLGEAKDSVGLLFALEAIKMFIKGLDGATNVGFLHGGPQPQEQNMAMAKMCVKV